MNGNIIILVMAEEKWEEADFLRKQIESRGYKAQFLDIGLILEPEGPCDITRGEVIAASGQDPKEVAKITDRGKRMPIMVAGGIIKVGQLHSEGNLQGIISIGGTTGTQMGAEIMRSLPYGVPKFGVSSTVSLLGFASRAFGTGDITMMNSVVDFTGLKGVMMRNALARAAGAICGMVDAAAKVPIVLPGKDEKPLVAITQIGLCEQCAASVRKELEAKGYQVAAFSATGTCDRAMEKITERDKLFGAVIDLSPGGVAEQLFDFGMQSGPTRLEAAGKVGIPQVIALCKVNIGSPTSRNYRKHPEYYERKKFEYDAARTFIRLSEDELILVADTMADKLNKSSAPVKVVVPLGGWSAIDKRGTYFYDEELDRVFVNEFKKQLRPDIEVREVDADLDTPEFAQAVIKALDDIMIT
jgi:uncharacterized protein (UPF0261 family)